MVLFIRLTGFTIVRRNSAPHFVKSFSSPMLKILWVYLWTTFKLETAQSTIMVAIFMSLLFCPSKKTVNLLPRNTIQQMCFYWVIKASFFSLKISLSFHISGYGYIPYQILNITLVTTAMFEIKNIWFKKAVII